MDSHLYPAVVDPALVGTYSPLANSGAEFVWDEVLEYRVWCHPERGAPPQGDEPGDDYHIAFATYPEALAFSERTPGSEEPLALVLQWESIDEPTAMSDMLRSQHRFETQPRWMGDRTGVFDLERLLAPGTGRGEASGR